jgi:hypothetical protein
VLDCAELVYFCDPVLVGGPVFVGGAVTVPVTACDWSARSVFDPVDVWAGMPFWDPLTVCHSAVVYECLAAGEPPAAPVGPVSCDPPLAAPETRRPDRSVDPTARPPEVCRVARELSVELVEP